MDHLGFYLQKITNSQNTRLLLLLGVIISSLVLASCGSSKNMPAMQKTRYSNFIYEEEIQSHQSVNALILVETLRPRWVRSRGQKTSLRQNAVWVEHPIIYVNGSMYGNMDSLRMLSVMNITEMEYLSPGDATIRYGMNHTGGAILIKMFY